MSTVVHGKLHNAPGAMETDDVIGITGHEGQQIESFNQQSIQLGQMQPDPAFKEEVEQALKEQSALDKDEQAVCLIRLTVWVGFLFPSI